MEHLLSGICSLFIAMSPPNLVQIPFSAFKTIDLAQHVALEVYQSLYDDHTEPVGLVSATQALGLLKPTDQAIDSFNERWAPRDS